MKFPSYEECMALVPKNAVYVILQLSNDKSELYFGCLANEKGEEEYKQRVIAKKTLITKLDLKVFTQIRTNIKKIQKNLSYLAYEDPEKLTIEIEKMNSLLSKAKEDLSKHCDWWLKELLSVLNNVKEV